MRDHNDSNTSVTQRAFGEAADNFGRQIAPVGAELGVVTAKVARLLISGLDKSVYGLETVGAWIQEQVSTRLKAIPEDKIVEPNPRIAVPATQALIYSMNEELIREMFANLLAADMNLDTKRHAHPAFVEMIREMTGADARVLQVFKTTGQVEFVVRLVEGNKWHEFGFAYSFELPDLDIVQTRTAISNLRRLELIEFRPNEWPLLPDLESQQSKLRSQYTNLEELARSSEEFRQAMKFDNPPSLIIALHGLFPTPFGREFINICLRS